MQSLNILSLLAEMRQYETLKEISKFSPQEVQSYLNNKDFLISMMIETGLLITPVASLDEFIAKANHWKISTIEKAVTDEITSGNVDSFNAKLRELIADRAGMPQTYKSITRVTSILIQLAVKASNVEDWQSAFDACAGYFDNTINAANQPGPQDPKDRQNLVECIRVCKSAIEVALLAGNKIFWLVGFRRHYNSPNGGAEITQLWFDRNGDVELGIKLGVDGGNINLAISDATSPSVENVVKNAHRIFWQLDVIQNGRAFALKRTNSQLFDYAISKDPILAFAEQNNLASVNPSNPQHLAYLKTLVQNLIGEGKYDYVTAYLRLGFFTRDLVFEVMHEGMQHGYCEIYEAMQKSNEEAGKTWKSGEIYDLSFFKKGYDDCIAKRSGLGTPTQQQQTPATPTPTLPTPATPTTPTSPTPTQQQESMEEMTARHAREMQERQVFEDKQNEQWTAEWNAGDAVTKQRLSETVPREQALWPQQRQEIVDQHARELAALSAQPPKLQTPVMQEKVNQDGETREQVVQKYEDYAKKLEESHKAEEAQLIAAYNASTNEIEKGQIIDNYNNQKNNVWTKQWDDLKKSEADALAFFA